MGNRMKPGKSSVEHANGRTKCVVTCKPIPENEICAVIAKSTSNRYSISRDGLLELLDGIAKRAPRLPNGACGSCGSALGLTAALKIAVRQSPAEPWRSLFGHRLPNGELAIPDEDGGNMELGEIACAGCGTLQRKHNHDAQDQLPMRSRRRG